MTTETPLPSECRDLRVESAWEARGPGEAGRALWPPAPPLAFTGSGPEAQQGARNARWSPGQPAEQPRLEGLPGHPTRVPSPHLLSKRPVGQSPTWTERQRLASGICLPTGLQGGAVSTQPQAQVLSRFRVWAPDSRRAREKRKRTMSCWAVQGPPTRRSPGECVGSAGSHPPLTESGSLGSVPPQPSLSLACGQARGRRARVSSRRTPCGGAPLRNFPQLSQPAGRDAGRDAGPWLTVATEHRCLFCFCFRPQRGHLPGVTRGEPSCQLHARGRL